jgi:flagellar hook assembly protein FlgD/PKD repeat protein/lysophospholipase L1-like esterase
MLPVRGRAALPVLLRGASSALAMAVVFLVAAAVAGAHTTVPPDVLVTSTDRAFSPNGDGQEDQVSVTYQLLLPSRVTVTITDENSEVVRTVDGGTDRPAGSSSLSWDGRNGNGTTAPDGWYGYRIAAVSAAGNTTNAGGTIYLDSRIPARFAAPAAGDTVTGLVAAQVRVAEGLTLSGAQANVVNCHGAWLQAGCGQAVFGPDIDGGAALGLDADTWYSGANALDGYVDYLDQLGQSHRYTLPRLPLTVRRPARITNVSPDRAFSPDGDGQEDHASIGYELWTAAHVDVVVRNAGGERVRQLEAGASHSEGSQSFAWDGRDDGGEQVPSGEYTYTITAQGAFGDPATATGRIGVDRRSPATIVQPVAGARLSGVTRVRVAPADGLTLTYASFSVDRCENPYLDDSWQACQAYAQTIDADGSMAADLNTDAWYSGPNKVYASVNYVDAYGQSHNYAIPGTAVDVPRPVRITSVSADRYFSPDADGYDETTSISYWLSEDARTTVAISTAGGEPVRTVEAGVARLAGGYQYFSWDGRDEDGAIAPDGVYDYKITAVPEDGSDAASVTGRIGVDTRAPAHVTAPSSGASLTGVAHVRVAPADGLALTSVQASVDNCESPYLNGTYWGNCNAYAYSPGDPDGSFTTDLDTGSWRAGPVAIGVTVGYTDPFGQSHSITLPPVAVTVPRELRIADVAPPRAFSPDGDGQEDVSSLTFWLSGDAATTIAVTRADGSVVRALASDVAQTYGTQHVTWDGRDDDGHVVPDGTYTYRISSRPAGGAAVTATTDVGVDARAPATFAQPAAGEALSGVVQVRVVPRDGLTLTGLQTGSDCENPYLDGIYWGNCNASSYDPLSDGALAVSMNTDAWTPGDGHLWATVQYTDAFGQGHAYALPSLAVSVPRVARITEVTPDRYLELGQESSTGVYFRLSTPAATTVTVRDGDHTIVRRVESGVSRSNGYNWFSWDGRDDDGALLPDGVYTYTIDARPASGDPATFTGHIGLDRRPPGTVQTPQDGDTVSGVAQLVFVPRAEIATSYVDFCVDRSLANRCVSVFGASGADPWHTSRDTLDLPDGDLTIAATVGYADPFGQPHNATLSRSVTVDNTTPSAELDITPGSGPAPLQSGLQIVAYQPRGATLDYTVDFGDGTAEAAGTVAAPYPAVKLAHTFTTPGTYRVRATVSDGHGHVAKRTQDVTVTAPVVNHPPTATLTADPATGAAPVDATATVAGTDEDGDALTYALDFGDGSTASGGLPHAALHHIYDKAGSYLLRLTVSDGEHAVMRTTRVDVALAEPLAAAAGDDLTVTTGQAVQLDGSGSRPSAGIERYRWTFGDGTAGEDGARVSHTYGTAGTYTATLAVTAGGRTESDTATITVADPPATPSIAVNVTDDATHATLPGAQILVITADGRRFSAISDGAGRAALDGVPDGSYTFYAYKPGYRPDTGTLRVADGKGSGAIALAPGQIATTQLDAHRMTRDEIIAAGIDPGDPANQHVFEFEIHLAFRPNDPPVVFSGYATGSGGGGGGFYGASLGGSPCTAADFCRGTVGGVTYEVHVVWVDDAPMLQWLVIPGRAKFLKEFFDISMIVQNLAAPAFTLESGHAELSLPQGLNLAPTPTPQALGVPVGSIPGGGSASVHWLVRGDEEGSYSPSASYSGLLQPIAVPVSLRAQLAEPFKVWGGSALKMIVDADGAAVAHEPYRLRVGLRNVADVPVYNPSIELFKQGKLNYIYQPRERLEQGAKEVAPGDTFWADFVLVPRISGTLVLEKSFVKKTGGDVSLESEIQSHPRTPALDLRAHARKDAVVLEWDPVPGASDYAIYTTPDEETDFPDQPVAARPLGPNKVLVSSPHLDHSVPTPWYAVSPVVAGRPAMAHPMAQKAGEEESPYPTSSVDVIPDCDSHTATLSMSFDDPDFPVTRYQLRREGQPWDDPIALAAGSTSATAPVTADHLGDSHQVRSGNSEGEWGPVEDVSTDVCGTYVALGDSFSSGEGNPDFSDGPGDQVCHRSPAGYPQLVANQLLATGSAAQFRFVACTGAVMGDISVPNPTKQVGGHALPAQADALDHATKLVTVTIGGNNVEFATILESCLASGLVVGNTIPCATVWGPALSLSLSDVQNALEATYQLIRTTAPNARILVVGYPQLFPPVAPLTCWGISLIDTVWMHRMIDHMNDVIRDATVAANAGVEYVAPPSFSGHETCPLNPFADRWINSPRLPAIYSFHPNGDGHAQLADAVMGALQQPDGAHSFTLKTNESATQAFSVASGQDTATFSTHWAGSTFQLSLESPSGRRVDGDSADGDVVAAKGANWETITIKRPEAGAWKATVKAISVPREGEAVLVDELDVAKAAEPPTAQFSIDQPADEPGRVKLDARPSFDPDGSISEYRWSFGDGLTGTGAQTEHRYARDGRYVVDLQVTDDHGAEASSTQEVTVTGTGGDSTPPALRDVPADRAAEATGPSGATVAFTAPTATDDVDGTVAVTCAPASGTTFAIGTTTVTCSAHDAAGNEAKASFDVSVRDTTAPALRGVPSDISATAPDSRGAVVTYALPGATDAVDGDVPVTCVPASGTTFAIGETTVRCTASDARGNSASASFGVHVAPPGPARPLTALQQAISGPGVPKSVQTMLKPDLAAVAAAIDDGHMASACAALAEFDDELNAASRQLSAAIRADLRAKAAQLRTALDCAGTVRLLGRDRVGTLEDRNDAGTAEAFRATADVTGTLRALTVRLTKASAAKKLIVGLYANSGQHPGKLLTSGLISSPKSGWVDVALPATELKAGTRYWIALLSPRGAGTVRFTDRCCSTADRGPTETSMSTKLTGLPSTWSGGHAYNDGMLSAFGHP